MFRFAEKQNGKFLKLIIIFGVKKYSKLLSTIVHLIRTHNKGI